MPLQRPTRVATALCFALPFAAYAWTAARTLQGGDSGEYALVGMIGGVAHPPGYPLYVLLARVGAHLFPGPPFFRVALVSAACGAACVAVIQRAAWWFTSDLFASIAAALVFAFSRTQWRLAGLPEVFTLNALLAAVIVLLSLRFADGARPGRLMPFLIGLCAGLGLSNHLSIIWCAPIALWALVEGMGRVERSQWPRTWLPAIAGGLIGLLPYAALPIMAKTAQPGALVWGDATTLDGFLEHVLRKEYGTFRLSGAGDAVVFHIEPLLAYLRELPAQFAYVGAALGVAGIWLAIRADRSGTWPLLISFLLAGVLFMLMLNTSSSRRVISITIEERFHLLATLLLVPFVARGISWAVKRVSPRARAVWLAVVLVPFAIYNRGEANWAADSYTERYLIAAVRWTEPNTVLVSSSDTEFFGTRWVAQVLRERPDVADVDIAVVRSSWYPKTLAKEIPDFPMQAVQARPWQLARALAETGHVTAILRWANIDRSHFATEPNGFVDRIVSRDIPPLPLSEVRARLERATDFIGDQPPHPMDAYGDAVRGDAGEKWIELGKAFQRSGDEKQAAECGRRGLAIIPPEWTAK